MSQIRFPTPTRDTYSASSVKGNWNTSHLEERGIDLTPVEVGAIFKEEGGDEDEPWTFQANRMPQGASNLKNNDSRDLMARTPPRSRTPIDFRGRTSALTPLGRVSDARANTRPRLTPGGNYGFEPAVITMGNLYSNNYQTGNEPSLGRRQLVVDNKSYGPHSGTRKVLSPTAADNERDNSLLKQRW
eukprot:Gregarina_sp_Poly_1__7666@NODE_4311_length_652_cov_103_625641_g2858_i0_p1_GENE_NODE_4311_length_652_cov_103_625641_g2858_i0NODE_4311_length_652_cov_103_625641_g2858_i0_p1_ORF_typecomplete_len201_score25_59_NODE_4311_length_652_cov_103_625641_g2858_i043603